MRKHSVFSTVTPTPNQKTNCYISLQELAKLKTKPSETTQNLNIQAIEYNHSQLNLRQQLISDKLKENNMSNHPNRVSEFFNSDSETGNLLWQYVKSLSPDTVTQLSKPSSNEVFQVMERNIVGLLGNLPSEHFGVTITTNRENLGRLLASAMISGYFLRNAEQRMDFEVALQGSDLEEDAQ